jgi:3-oxoacyl-[acyl-carrier-protein] synthase-1
MIPDPKVRVGIVGLGVRCAVGLTAASAAAAVRSGVSRLREHPYLLDREGEPMVMAREPTLDPAEQGASRFAHLAAPAIQQALAPLRSSRAAPPVRVLIGLPGPRPGLPPGVPETLEELLEESSVLPPRSDPPIFVERGHAAGLLAMEQAWTILGREGGTCCLVGGVDSYLSADTLEWMDEEGILKSPANRNGLPPGEAAGFCLLATDSFAARAGLPVYAWLASAASAHEPHRIRTGTVCVGRGLSDAIAGATAPLRARRLLVDDSICDLNGEPYRSEEFTFTVLRTQAGFVDFTRFATPADCWGDVGAASGPLYASLAVASGRRGYMRGPHTMLWASSEGGDRAAVVVELAPGRLE